jgi:hypothetical protein
MPRTLNFLLALLFLAACSQTVGPRQPELTAAPENFPEDPFPQMVGTRFRVIPAESLVKIKVFRGGRLASFGHNHVITSRELGGEVLVTEELAGAKASLYLPVASLVVDDPVYRKEAGEGFEYPLEEKDREATRSNMLGERLLNGAGYPDILVRVLELQDAEAGMQAKLQITVLDTTTVKQVPVEFSLDDCTLSVNSSFELTHAELGLEPFSVLGGMLQVQQPIQVAVEVVAREPLAEKCQDT